MQTEPELVPNSLCPVTTQDTMPMARPINDQQLRMVVHTLLVTTTLVLTGMYFHPQHSGWPNKNAHVSTILAEDGIAFIPTPNGYIVNNPAWMPHAETIVGAFGLPRGDLWTFRLHTIERNGSNLTALPIPDDPECKYTSHHFPRVLPDEKIGFIQRCWVSLSPERRLPQERTTLMMYDPNTGLTERLVPYYLQWNANNFDFSPDMTRGIIHDGAFTSSSLHWLLPDGMERLALPLRELGYPRWSPDGRHIAVTGTPTSLPTPGRSEPPTGQQLYLLSLDEPDLQPVLDNVRQSTGAPAWSPNADWLAIRMTMRDGRDGIWLVKVATGTLYPVLLNSDVGAANWSPDGRSLVVAAGTYSGLPDTPLNDQRGIYVIDLPDLGEL